MQLTRGRVSSPTIGYDDGAATPPPSTHDDRLPARIGRYVVVEVIGIGGMGVVCTAYDPKLDRKVALKLLRQRESDDAARSHIAQLRLQREARALAKLKHPNIVAVHDVDIVDDRLYIAMEYVEGESLDDWFEHSTRGWSEVVEVFIQAAKGLQAAHAAGITHRDFKPANVRLEPTGRVVVLDFGLALAQGRANTEDDDDPAASSSVEVPIPIIGNGQEQPIAERNPRLTAVGRRVGTPAYMSPEQILGHAVGPATDQFAFGASLYEALYGMLPFRGDADAALWNAVEGAVAPPPKDREVPPWLHKVVLRLLDRDPQHRYADMAEVIAALSQGLGRRRRGRVAAVAIGATVVLGGLGWAYARQDACPGAADRMDARWNAARGQTLAQDFAATGAPFAEDAASRTIAVLDDRSNAWRRAHVEICEATRLRGEQSDALLDHRMACLDDALLELGALVDVFTETDAELVEHAVVATMGLADPRACRDDRPDDDDQAPSAAEEQRVAAVREQVAKANALIEAMRVEPAFAAAQLAWNEAAHLEHAPTRVAARLMWARTLRLRSDYAGAETELVAQIQDAAAHRLFDTEADAWIMHLQLLGLHLRRPEHALGERLAAEAAVTRGGGRPERIAGLAHALGVVLTASGDLEAAAEQFRTAIRHRQEHDGPDNPSVAAARNDLGITLVRLGRHREAEDAFRAALEAHRRALGETHPLVATNSMNLGNAVAEGRRDYVESATLYAKALAIREAVFGAEDPAVAEVLVAQGSLARRQGDHAAAVNALRRAVALFGGPDAKDLRAGMALNNLGTSYIALGDTAAAVDAFTHAIALFEREKATHHPSRLRAYLRRCEAHGAAGDIDAANRDCDTAGTLLGALATPNASDLADLAKAREVIAAQPAQRR